ncbi:hypothetical protein AVEN_86231-1 [Araneus ventricosus]|uniref:Uncharacterized protein n=1 Tax=Araneus ventricosus TaxID=182803 RepID=A0A4Y2IMW2_ARAVE|nr:hypothetical protein AVEN_86231-1 [Araneus ventricosus]
MGKPQACKNMIRCGLFFSTCWADLKTLRIIRESQTSDMPAKEAMQEFWVCWRLNNKQRNSPYTAEYIAKPIKHAVQLERNGGLKLAFSRFSNICKMLMASVREHSMFEKTTDHAVENSVKKWSVYAKDREGGTSHRIMISTNLGK